MHQNDLATRLGYALAKVEIATAEETGVSHWDRMPVIRQMIETMTPNDRPFIEAALESARDEMLRVDENIDWQNQCLWANRFCAYLNGRTEAENPERLIARPDTDHGRRVVRLGDQVWTMHIQSNGQVYAQRGMEQIVNVTDLRLGGMGKVREELF
jgi:hypothetical protein